MNAIFLGLLLVAIVNAAAGAWLSIKIKGGWNPLLYIINAIFAGATWGLIVKYGGVPIIVASVTYDVVYALTFYFGLTFLSGQPFTVMQGLGAIIAVIGTVMVSVNTP